MGTFASVYVYIYFPNLGRGWGWWRLQGPWTHDMGPRMHMRGHSYKQTCIYLYMVTPGDPPWSIWYGNCHDFVILRILEIIEKIEELSESNSQGFDQRRLLFMLWSISWCSFCFCSEFCCEHIPSGILASSVFRTVLLKYCGYEHGVSIEIVQPPLHSGLFRFQHYLRYRKDHVSMAIDAFSRKVRNLIVDAACAARFFSAG